MPSSSPSLYRRHRPRTFADVVGQEAVVRTLQNAVERDQVHHAYLFVGSRGTGKTSMAKILAACLNCDDGPTVTPCGHCDACLAIHNATSLDVIEMDAASNNSVDDIRDLRDKVAFAPVSGKHKVYILDEAHMLSPQAWNAFLKTLEEPPPRTIFVLATTEAQKVLPTVVDRCHRFDFGRPSVEQVATVLGRVAAQEGIDIDGGALALVARHATGSFRDALGTLEQLLTYAGGARIAPADVLNVLGVADAESLFAAVDAVLARDAAEALRAANRLADAGRDAGQVLRDLEVHARELLTVQVLKEVPPELRVTPERDARLAEQAASLSDTDAVRLLDLVAAALEATSDGAQPRIQLELLLIKASAPQLDPSTSALLARIEQLERGRQVAGAPAAQPADTVADRAPAAMAEAPAAAPPAPPAPPATSLETILAAWPAVVDLVRDQNIMIGALLEGARPVELEGDWLTVAFPAQAAFLKRKAEQEEHRRIAADALRQVTGRSLALRYELRDPQAGGEASAPPATLSGEELVRRFLAEFDAEELTEDEPEGREKAETS